MISNIEIVVRLSTAALLGSVIGLERERRRWAAGLRTHMLVCVGAALIMIVSAFGFVDALGDPNVELDVSRVAAQVVSGVGFLGAGTIILRREVIRGLTTAASLWTVAAIGLAVGGGLYIAAISATVLILAILAGLKPLERWLFAEQPAPRILLTVNRREGLLPAIESTLASAGLDLKQITIKQGKTSQEQRIYLRIKSHQQTRIHAAIEQLRTLPGVQKINHVP